MLFAFILVSVVLAALAQLTLKHGMTQVTHHGDMPLDLKQPVQTARRVVTNAAVWAGLLTFVASAAVWIVPSSLGCGSSVLAMMATLAPSLAARSAIDKPMPRLPPDITSTFPASDLWTMVRLP